MIETSHTPPTLANELSLLFSLHGKNDAALIDGIDALVERFGAVVYRETLRHLCGKSFDDDLAKCHWLAALQHRQRLLQPTRVVSGLRAALLDYLQREVGELDDPRILEGAFLEHITQSSLCDGLTGLYHQTHFKELLAKTVAGHRRKPDGGFALLLFDLDHFKQYNDRCGHLCGDEALRRTAEILQKSLREGDVAARYGGEEFAMLLPRTDRNGAQIVAERVRRAIEREPFPTQERLDRHNLTISGGVAIFPEDGDNAAELIETADHRLYQAKARRNAIFPLRQDRRRSHRSGVRSLVEYATIDGTIFRPALAQDISPHGIGLGCETAVEPGTTLALRLTRPFWRESVQLRATVRGIRCQGEMVWVGLEFDRVMEGFEQLMPGLLPALRHDAIGAA